VRAEGEITGLRHDEHLQFDECTFAVTVEDPQIPEVDGRLYHCRDDIDKQNASFVKPYRVCGGTDLTWIPHPQYIHTHGYDVAGVHESTKQCCTDQFDAEHECVPVTTDLVSVKPLASYCRPKPGAEAAAEVVEEDTTEATALPETTEEEVEDAEGTVLPEAYDVCAEYEGATALRGCRNCEAFFPERVPKCMSCGGDCASTACKGGKQNYTECVGSAAFLGCHLRCMGGGHENAVQEEGMSQCAAYANLGPRAVKGCAKCTVLHADNVEKCMGCGAVCNRKVCGDDSPEDCDKDKYKACHSYCMEAEVGPDAEAANPLTVKPPLSLHGSSETENFAACGSECDASVCGGNDSSTASNLDCAKTEAYRTCRRSCMERNGLI
jgi:hypothetical protein